MVLRVGRPELDERIDARVDRMWAAGFADEVNDDILDAVRAFRMVRGGSVSHRLSEELGSGERDARGAH